MPAQLNAQICIRSERDRNQKSVTIDFDPISPCCVADDVIDYIACMRSEVV